MKWNFVTSFFFHWNIYFHCWKEESNHFHPRFLGLYLEIRKCLCCIFFKLHIILFQVKLNQMYIFSVFFHWSLKYHVTKLFFKIVELIVQYLEIILQLCNAWSFKCSEHFSILREDQNSCVSCHIFTLSKNCKVKCS